MPSDRLRSRRGSVPRMPPRLVVWMLALVVGLTLSVAAAPEDQLFRQVKVDVFDQNWSAVLRGCEEILASYPSGSAAAQASFFRARALTRLPGREAEGIKAFRAFIADRPGDRVMVEQAWAALFSAACDPRSSPRPECPAVLKDGLGSASHYVSTLAAIQASDAPDEGLRKKALGILKQAYEREADTEIRNEILIAILKIDPKEVPSTEPQRPHAPGTTSRKIAPGTHPTLIRMTVYNKQEKRYDLKVNLPVAFARMLIDAVGQDQKEAMRNVARGKGIDLDDIFDAIESSGTGKLLEVDDATCHIEIWIE